MKNKIRLYFLLSLIALSQPAFATHKIKSQNNQEKIQKADFSTSYMNYLSTVAILLGTGVLYVYGRPLFMGMLGVSPEHVHTKGDCCSGSHGHKH